MRKIVSFCTEGATFNEGGFRKYKETETRFGTVQFKLYISTKITWKSPDSKLNIYYLYADYLLTCKTITMYRSE